MRFIAFSLREDEIEIKAEFDDDLLLEYLANRHDSAVFDAENQMWYYEGEETIHAPSDIHDDYVKKLDMFEELSHNLENHREELDESYTMFTRGTNEGE